MLMGWGQGAARAVERSWVRAADWETESCCQWVLDWEEMVEEQLGVFPASVLKQERGLLCKREDCPRPLPSELQCGAGVVHVEVWWSRGAFVVLIAELHRPGCGAQGLLFGVGRAVHCKLSGLSC